MYQSTSWRPVESLTAAAADQHPSPTAYSAEENGSIVEAAQQFKRGQHVVCKPGVFAYRPGQGEVRDVIDGTVIVYFDDLGATVYAPSELAASEAYEAAASAWMAEHPAQTYVENQDWAWHCAYVDERRRNGEPGINLTTFTTYCEDINEAWGHAEAHDIGLWMKRAMLCDDEPVMYLMNPVGAWDAAHAEYAQRGTVTACERLPLGAPVTLCNGVQAVISGHSTASASRYRVSYFDRRFWSVRHKWTERENFEVRASNETATAV